MAGSGTEQRTGERRGAGDRREERADRILQAAGELLTALGYRRVSISEVAERAGVGKGTVYLHFPTKEALFLSVLMRSQERMLRAEIAEMRADPAAILPGRIASAAYRMVDRDPVARTVVTGDTETLGVLARTAATEVAELSRLRFETLGAHFRLLDEHGLLRPGGTPEERMYGYAATVAGFLVIGALSPFDLPGGEAPAELLGRTVRDAFEAGPEPDPERLRAAAPAAIGLFQNLLDRLVEEIARQKSS
ncbi:TetR/AcrR family transcriptional regulator [Nocardiopsis potens]|uniref:TetR/AcrR family transcriptional regulator n=1 Tax=Nocardiopsis potens TaxID=1246458 RepID=UPI00035F2C5C|nr:TetR/AcrR family transcriptional regulator [Nocardiopsis potens]